MIAYFSPTRFEIPLSLQLKAKAFGIGERRARSFAQELNNQHHAYSRILIFGSAGGLDEDLKAGETFEVTEILTESLRFEMKPRTELPKSRLFTSKRVLATSEKKKAAKEKHGASMVDMEMGFILDATSEEVREKLIFIRSVFDPMQDELVASWSLPLRLAKNYAKYHEGITRAFSLIDP